MMMSPSRAGAVLPDLVRPGPVDRSCGAGNDSTLVGLSIPRQSRLSLRMAASSASTTLTSPLAAGSARVDAAAVMTASRTVTCASGCAFHSSDSTTISICAATLSATKSLPGGRNTCRACLVIGFHDARHEFVTDDVLSGEHDLSDAFHIGQKPQRLVQAGHLAGRQIDLARIAGHDHAAVLSQPGQEHLHLHRRGVLRLVEDDRGIGEGATAHERQGGDFDLAGLQRALDDARLHQVEQRIVDRSQIGIDLLAHVAGKEAETLSRLHGRARQNDAIHFLAFEQGDGMRHRKPGLAGPGRAGAEHQRVALERANIGVLAGCARAHRTLAQVDFLETRPRRRFEIEQRSLRDRMADRAFDVAGDQIVAALELLVEPFQHAPSLLHRFAIAFDRDMVAARIRHDTEPAFDQREILSVLTEQRGRQSVVVEGEHGLGDARAGLGAGNERIVGSERPHQAPAMIVRSPCPEPGESDRRARSVNAAMTMSGRALMRSGSRLSWRWDEATEPPLAPASAPNRLLVPTSVIVTETTSPISEAGAMTWTGWR